MATSSDNFDDAYDNEGDTPPLDGPPGDFHDNTYIAGPDSQRGPIPVQKDDVPLDNYIDGRSANSNEVLGIFISSHISYLFLIPRLACRKRQALVSRSTPCCTWRDPPCGAFELGRSVCFLYSHFLSNHPSVMLLLPV